MAVAYRVETMDRDTLSIDKTHKAEALARELTRLRRFENWGQHVGLSGPKRTNWMSTNGAFKVESRVPQSV